jgi:hypothetical protein
MMQEITIEELLPFVLKAFEGDMDLPKYHISDNDFAWHTYNEIMNTAKVLPLTCYKVGDFGFTVTSPGLLYSFGINVEYRTPEILQLWFAEIKNILGSFDCMLHSKNDRAINHLIKQGMSVKGYATILTI